MSEPTNLEVETIQRLWAEEEKAQMTSRAWAGDADTYREWYNQRGHLFDKQLMSNIKWMGQPWYKRLWCRIIGDTMEKRNQAINDSFTGKDRDGNPNPDSL